MPFFCCSFSDLIKLLQFVFTACIIVSFLAFFCGEKSQTQSRDTPATDSNHTAPPAFSQSPVTTMHSMLSPPRDGSCIAAAGGPLDFLVETTRRGKRFTQRGARHHSPALMCTRVGEVEGAGTGKEVAIAMSPCRKLSCEQEI